MKSLKSLQPGNDMIAFKKMVLLAVWIMDWRGTRMNEEGQFRSYGDGVAWTRMLAAWTEEIEQFEIHFARLVDGLHVRSGENGRVKKALCVVVVVVFSLSHWMVIWEPCWLPGSSQWSGMGKPREVNVPYSSSPFSGSHHPIKTYMTSSLCSTGIKETDYINENLNMDGGNIQM